MRIIFFAGDQIFSIHAQPSGPRFATAGGDSRVCIWSILPALDARQENDAESPKLLATLTDHNGPVNALRFAHKSDWLATGSDDCVAFIYEFKGGAGENSFGGEGPSEKWRPKHILRGHSSHIVDLAWSKDDSMLASASLDNTVAIWNTSNGQRITTLTAHTSFVKGVSWDPVGTYIATQSEDKSVIIWRIEDWSLVAKITAPFERMLTSTFACRLSWSPDGQYLLAGNSFQGATHAAIAIPRENWNHPEEYLLICGHGNAVVANAFCPRLFHVPPLGGGPPGEELSTIFALGAQDRRVTVWAASAQRPIFVGQRFFKHGQVTDVTWTSDGYALLAVSSEGSVACLQFEPSEIGKPASKDEIDEVMKSLYGSAKGRPTRRVFAESADQLERDAPHHDKAASPKAHPRVPFNERIQMASNEQSRHPMLHEQSPANGTLTALNARLGGDSGQHGFTQTGFGSADMNREPNQIQSSTAMPPPAPRYPPQTGAELTDLPEYQPNKRVRLDLVCSAAARRKMNETMKEASLLQELKICPSLRIPLGEFPRFFSTNRAPSSHYLEMHVVNKKEGIGSIPHVQPKHQAEISMMMDGKLAWTDLISGSYVVAAAGSHLFSALVTDDGHIYIYSPNGRRKTAPFKAGSKVAFLTASASPGHRIREEEFSNAARRLLFITTTGILRVIDAVSLQHVAAADVSPLLLDGHSIVDARLTMHGIPVVSLSNCTAYTWNNDLQSWVRIADESMTLSRYAPMISMPNMGEVGAAQASALASTGMPIASGSSFASAAAQISRGHVETNLAASIVMESPDEYCHWLRTYAKILSENGDKDRLDELCQELYGKPNGISPEPWEPRILGLSKLNLLKNTVASQVRQNRALENEILPKYLSSIDSFREVTNGDTLNRS